MPDTPTYPAPTSAELRARLDARTQAIQQRLSTLRHEVTTVADVSVNGRPVTDYVRARPFYYTGLSLAGGLALGLLAGLVARARRRSPLDEHAEVFRLYAASLLDAAATRVARGEEAGKAIEKALRQRAPVVHNASPKAEAKSTLGETFDVAVKTALGFGVKAGMDALVKRFTHQEELFSAVKEAKDNPEI